MSDSPFTCLVAGLKGARFLEDIVAAGLRPQRVVSYSQADDASHSYVRIQQLAVSVSAQFEESRRPRLNLGEFVFAVGWQFLMPDSGAQLIVFHDSLLPRYRGFAPTVTALINGDAEIGVTAIFPSADADAGRVVAQKALRVTYPIKIAAALEAQASAMAALACKIIGDLVDGPPAGVEQDHAAATYSIWRDELDYQIDWTEDANRIARTVDALGPPYGGARTFMESDEIIIDACEPLPDLPFEIRQPGKIWLLGAGQPSVVCGSGLLRILSARHLNSGVPVAFNRLRRRLGR